MNRPRPDAHAKVTGGFTFANDLAVDGMLHGAILRSPHAHARIRRLDIGPALAIDGQLMVDVGGGADRRLAMTPRSRYDRIGRAIRGQRASLGGDSHPMTGLRPRVSSSRASCMAASDILIRAPEGGEKTPTIL